LSNLPDVIIGCILLFLPTKEAICTSVLSKKWIYLWRFITNLEFEDRDTFCIKISISKAPIYNFVDKILLCLKSSIIQSFSLFIIERYNNHRFDKWIYNIINWIQKIKKLY
ncbi:Putative F-box protein, partial [Glycine soja]